MTEPQNDKNSNGMLRRETAGVAAPRQKLRSARATRWRALAAGLALGLFFAFITIGAASSLRDYLHGALANVNLPAANRPSEIPAAKRAVARLQKFVNSSNVNLQSLTPPAPYLIIDTSENRIYLWSGTKLLHETVCSSGSYVLLKASNNQQWMFSTPRGVFRVLGKHHAPVWRRPDWAFVEEGLPIPAPYAAERYETGVLGEYGIDFGNGYLIHGTLYQRQLGLPVTHGCIRLGDEDLRIVYRNLQVGSKIFIY